jgi:HEAT repeat protein
VDFLLDLLANDPDPEIRRYAAVGLGQTGDVRAVPVLLSALQSGDARLSLSAIESLGELPARESVEALIEALRSADPTVRLAAAAALGRIGDARAAEPLFELAAPHGGGVPPEVRIATASALVQLGDDRGIEALINVAAGPANACFPAARALSSVGLPALPLIIRDLPRRRGTLVEVLREMGEPASAALFAALRGQDAKMRAAAAWALGVWRARSEIRSHASRGPRVREMDLAQAARIVDTLRAATADEDPEVRRLVIWALIRIQSPRSLQDVIAALNDPDCGVREEAAWGLGWFDDDRAIAVLEPLLKDPDPEIRKGAAASLKTMREL